MLNENDKQHLFKYFELRRTLERDIRRYTNPAIINQLRSQLKSISAKNLAEIYRCSRRTIDRYRSKWINRKGEVT